MTCFNKIKANASYHGILFSILRKNLSLKQYLLLLFTVTSFAAKAQNIDSIYVNLYTDSLKKGTYNYINIDGLLSNGRYLPLDTAQLIFRSSAGKFSGNNLWVDADFSRDKIRIWVTLRQNPALHKEFDMYIKQKPDGPLKTVDELMNEMKNSKKKKN
jgi:hypothetical protein